MKPLFWQLRVALAIGILILEVMLLSLMVDAGNVSDSGLLALILSKAGVFLRWIIVSAGLLVLLLSNGFSERIQTLVSYYSPLSTFAIFVLHQGIFFILVVLTHLVFRQPDTESYYGYLWITTVCLTGLTWCLLIANSEKWRVFLSREQTPISHAFIGGAIIVALSFYFQQFWGSMTEFTFAATRLLLGLFYDSIIIDAAQNKLGVDEFWVYIAPVCSGIEGAMLAVSISSVYLYLSRSHLRFPHALILLPLTAIIAIVLNIIRIASLIIIGAEISPIIAIGSFHSVAGWVSAVLIALLLVLVFSSWKWIQKPLTTTPRRQGSIQQTDSSIALAILIPFVVYSSLTLLGKALSTEVDYLYPVKLFCTGAVMLYFWKQYDIRTPDRLQLSIFTGAIIAIVWVLLSPDNPQLNHNIQATFSTMSFVALAIWSIFRLTGYWLLVPILEELVFRGYLLHRLSGSIISNSQQAVFNATALLISSALFGLLHDAWLAGTVAGLLLATLRFKSKSLSNCIVAHSTANIMISIWAIYTGNWILI